MLRSAAWDQVTLVRYPRRAAYLDMQSDPAYVGAITDRTSGLSARLLYPFHDPAGDPDDPFRIERSGGDEVFVVRLHQRADVGITYGAPQLRSFVEAVVGVPALHLSACPFNAAMYNGYYDADGLGWPTVCRCDCEMSVQGTRRYFSPAFRSRASLGDAGGGCAVSPSPS